MLGQVNIKVFRCMATAIECFSAEMGSIERLPIRGYYCNPPRLLVPMLSCKNQLNPVSRSPNHYVQNYKKIQLNRGLWRKLPTSQLRSGAAAYDFKCLVVPRLGV